jgi:predicted outer membrane repeat protein
MDCRGAITVQGEPEEMGPKELVVKNSVFVGNYTEQVGGGAINAGFYNDGMEVWGCYFEDNQATSGGGAVAVGGFGPKTVENCVFWHNRTTTLGSGGGALFVFGGAHVAGNTFVENQGGHPQNAGSVRFSGGSSQFLNNIVAASSNGVGIRVTSGGTVAGGCNVFWQNADGNAIGYTLAPTDREVDPLLCDPEKGDFTVSAESPCLPPNSAGCGLIGALGQGCGMISVEPQSWGRIKGAYRLERRRMK